jgi:hypothetical protein
MNQGRTKKIMKKKVKQSKKKIKNKFKEKKDKLNRINLK